MKTAPLAMALAISVSMPLSMAQAADLAAARAFLAGLYTHYPRDTHGRGFDPVGASRAAVFDAPMLALFAEDDRLTQKGDSGAVDWDPLCNCQDDTGMVATIAALQPTGPTQATANITVRFTGGAPPTKLQLDLVSAGALWRIHDVHTQDVPSLRAYLEQTNREAAKGGHAEP